MSRAATLLRTAGLLAEAVPKLPKPALASPLSHYEDDWTPAQQRRAQLHVDAFNKGLIKIRPVTTRLLDKFEFGAGELEMSPQADALQCWVWAYDYDEGEFGDMEPIGFINMAITRQGKASYWFRPYSNNMKPSKRFDTPNALNKWLKDSHADLYRQWFGRAVPEAA